VFSTEAGRAVVAVSIGAIVLGAARRYANAFSLRALARGQF